MWSSMFCLFLQYLALYIYIVGLFVVKILFRLSWLFSRNSDTLGQSSITVSGQAVHKMLPAFEKISVPIPCQLYLTLATPNVIRNVPEGGLDERHHVTTGQSFVRYDWKGNNQEHCIGIKNNVIHTDHTCKYFEPIEYCKIHRVLKNCW